MKKNYFGHSLSSYSFELDAIAAVALDSVKYLKRK